MLIATAKVVQIYETNLHPVTEKKWDMREDLLCPT